MDDLESERILSEFGGVRIFVGNVNNSGVGDNVLGTFDDRPVLVGNRRDRLI